MTTRKKEDHFETGYFAEPKTSWNKVHITKNGLPICGYKPNKKLSFQFCSSGINLNYTDCGNCNRVVQSMFKDTCKCHDYNE
jgi:hypothetical protein